jgi:hypothetical protein
MEIETEKPKEIEKKPEVASQLILQANEAAVRIEQANARTEQLLRKQEELIAIQQLGGKAEAGTSLPQLSEDDEAKQALNKILKTTGLHI